MVEAINAGIQGRTHQLHGAHHVGLEEGVRMHDGAAVVRFGSEVDNDVDPVRLEGLERKVVVADVAAHEHVSLGLGRRHVGQVRQVGCVGQQVVVDDPVVRMVAQPIAHEVGADESGTAGDENCRHAQNVQNVRKRRERSILSCAG